MFYPERHHPIFMLQDSLQTIGIRADFARDDRTAGCWGMVFPDFNNRVLVWLIDNRHFHEQQREDPAARELLSLGAIVCHAQKPDADRAGGHWLPIAASPGFEPVKVAKTADVATVCYVRDEGRARILADVGKKFRLNLAQGIFGKQAVETYCSARIGLNVVTRFGDPTAYDSWNMRSPEIMACGVPLVTEYQPYLAELGLIDGVNYVAYRSANSVCEAIKNAMQITDVDIGAAGRQLILDRHTYQHRAEQVKQWLTC